MSAEDTLSRLEALAHRHLNFQGRLHPDTSLGGELAPDSLARLTLLVEVENAFATCIEDEDALRLRTVGDLVALLQQQASAQPTAPPSSSEAAEPPGEVAGPDAARAADIRLELKGRPPAPRSPQIPAATP